MKTMKKISNEKNAEQKNEGGDRDFNLNHQFDFLLFLQEISLTFLPTINVIK